MMIWFLSIELFLLLSYIVLMLLYERGWYLQPVYQVAADFYPKTKITVIIPARNEAGNINVCLESIIANHYPADLFEVIVIDDHSTDNTVDIVESFNQKSIKCVRLSEYVLQSEIIKSYKKKAIETGILLSNGELIITTDADCIVSSEWLRSMASVYETQQPAMIIGPVSFMNNGKLVSFFQSLDFMSMQGITVAAYRLQLGNMCNGANLAFSRIAFKKVNGYEGVDHLASGDDYLLLTKMKKQFPDSIAYLKSKDAIVQTQPQPDWKSFLNQRIRWASKMGKYDDKKITLILMLVYLFNLSFLLLFLAGFYDAYFWLLWLALLALKTFVELYYLNGVAAFFDKENELKIFPFLQPLHILYIITAGFLGFIGTYKWKGRNVK